MQEKVVEFTDFAMFLIQGQGFKARSRAEAGTVLTCPFDNH